MAALAFDTLAFAKELRAAGFNEAQAEAVTRVVRGARDADIHELSTKSDLRDLKSELLITIAETKAEILRWVVGLIGFQTLAILGGVALLLRLA